MSELQTLLESYEQSTTNFLLKINELSPRPATIPELTLSQLFYLKYLTNGSNNDNIDVVSLPVAFDFGETTETTQRTVTASNSPEINLITTISDRVANLAERLPSSPVANMTVIATDGTSGDKTILTPTSGKALRISSLCLTMASATAITLKKTSTAISGAMNISDLVTDFPQPIGLAIDQTFVVNVGSAIAVNGFVTWWEA